MIEAALKKSTGGLEDARQAARHLAQGFVPEAQTLGVHSE
jgi:hypothetical protein